MWWTNDGGLTTWLLTTWWTNDMVDFDMVDFDMWTTIHVSMHLCYARITSM